MVPHPFIRWCFILLLALFTIGVARAEYVDLSKGGVIVHAQPCSKEEKLYICMIVKHEEQTYLVLADEKGEAIMFRINEKDEPVQIWTRGQVSI